MPSTRCPDCSVAMEPVTMTGYTPKIKTGDNREGVLGKLGVDKPVSVDAVLCPECGRLQLYADI